jgi:hypothetical protein
VNGPPEDTNSEASIPEAELLDDSMLLEAGLADGESSPNKRKHLLHAPLNQANLDRVILTQTQVAPASQPWEIRGPIWRRPKPKTPEKGNEIAAYFPNAQKQMAGLMAAPSKSLTQVIGEQKKDVTRIDSTIIVEYVLKCKTCGIVTNTCF